jgi:glycosyltransferase involved in cell wall biosynthesis
VIAVPVTKEDSSKLLPIAIMAHNGEKVIQKAVENVLSQNIPIGYSVKVVIVANGGSDRTEEIVKGLEEQNPNRVVLISMTEKGKPEQLIKLSGFLMRFQIMIFKFPMSYFWMQIASFTTQKSC